MSEFDNVLKKRAAALKYDPEKNGAPVLVASGMGYMAEKITEAALNAGVPVYEDDSLATLLTQMKLGSPIPPELYQAIVEIYVYFLGYVSKPKAEPDLGDIEAGIDEEMPAEEAGDLPEGW